MKKFLAVYTGTPSAIEKWKAMDKNEREKREQAGIKAWMDWSAANAGATVAAGGPLGKTKRIGPDGVSDIRNNLTGYVVVEASSHEAAARMFEGHPHFTNFPGDCVEIMEFLPTPGM